MTKEQKPVICPWCKKEMTLCPELVEGTGDPEEPYSRWYECYMCGARSPIANADDAAYLAATATPENPPLTSKQVIALDDLDAVWMYSWGRSTPVTVESGRCAKMMLECPPKQQTPYGSDWWFFAHKPLYTDIIEAARLHSDC